MPITFTRLAVSAVAIACLLAGTAAKAGPILGSQGATSLDASGNDASLAAATSFTLASNSTTGSATGDYSGYGIAALDNTVLDTTSLSTFSFGSVDFGTFSASTGAELSGPADTRTFYFTGSFTPGSNLLFAGVSSNTASVLMNINQSGGTGGAISLSWTLNTPIAAPPTDPPANTPEPSTILLAGLGILSTRLLRRWLHR